MEKTCIVCGETFEAARADARFDKPSCRKRYQRNPEEYDGTPAANTPQAEKMTLEKPAVRPPFRFRTPNFRADDGFNENGFRTAKYWYDVPLAAIPFPYEGEPAMPDYMNGRQYFLWRAMDFKVNDKGQAVLLDPTPTRDAIQYVMGGEQSAMWSGRNTGKSNAPR